MSKYAEIAQAIRHQIKIGTYGPGAALPDQKTLAAHFHTSRMTLQKALDLLKTEGYIYGQQGAGTYVKYNAESLANMDVGVDQYVGTTELLGANHQLDSQIVHFQLRYPTETEQETLSLTQTQAVYDIVRARQVDGAPYSLEYTKMPVDLIPGVDEKVLTHSIYRYIEEQLGLHIGSAFRRIDARRSTEDDIKYLGNTASDPVLAVTNVVYLADGRPFEFSTTHQRYDKAHFSVFVPGRQHES
ncbi:GntR family transcriptional regulator [Lacticaseibacillus jixianensis]|uniref:GntR family transcriptional regulator n=1 Tax=Lacticaseibacillus jixianensis TaxID=2486012 RepID=A0ABW4BB03_9LACO|nr:GntR family transcriptional regulator [Lacticaseibacillus jixianensis]